MTGHKWLSLAWALVVFVLLGHNASMWLGQRIAPDTDIMALLPVQERDPVLQQSFSHMVDAAQQRVVVLVGAPEWEDAVRAANAYSAQLASRPDLLEPVKTTDQAQADWLEPFLEQRTVLLTAGQEAQLRSQGPDYWRDTALAGLYSAFSGPRLGPFQDDPFALFGAWVQERAQETPVRPRDGKLFVGDGKQQYVLMPLTLKLPAFSISTQQALTRLLKQAEAAAQAASPGARVIAAGVVLHAAAAAEQAAGEVATIGLGSVLGIVLLTWLAFGSLRPIALTLLSISIGFLGALSVSMLLFDRIHLLTLVFGASLIGVAQDYGIYFLCKRQGAERTLDSARLIRRLLPGLALTLLAAVIGYMGLALTPFPGLRQMALFSAFGLVFAWLTVVCWFPALVGPDTLKQGVLARRYGATLAWWPRLRMGRASLTVLTCAALVAALGWSRLSVDDDLRSLQATPKTLVADQLLVSRLLDAPSPIQYYLVRGDSAETVLQREEALKRRLDRLIEPKTIAGYQALSNWVPSMRTQADRLVLVDAKLLAPGGPLSSLAEAIGEDASWTAATRTRLLTQDAPLTVEAFLDTQASEPWRHLWLGRVDGVHASIVAVRGLDLAALAHLRQAGVGIDGVQWVDKVAEISSVLGRYRQSMGAVVLGAYALVLLLLLPRYRRNAWRVLAPTAVASLVTLAILGLAGQPLQLFHVLALMLLLGVGIDYGIFMQEHPDRRDTTSWLAVGLSAMSTLLAFGLLGLSNTPALQAFGITMLLGTTLAWLLVPMFASSKEHTDAS